MRNLILFYDIAFLFAVRFNGFTSGIYKNAIIIKLKNEAREFLFESISHIKTSNYFAPNPVEYHFEIIDKGSEKFTIAIPYVQYDDATLLLEAYKKYQLGSNFPQNLLESKFVLDNYLTYEIDKLVYSGKKGRE